MGKHDNGAAFIEFNYDKKKGYRMAFSNHKLVEDGHYTEFKNAIFCARSYLFIEKKTGRAVTIFIRGFDGYKKKHLDLDYVFKMLNAIDPMASHVSYITHRIADGLEADDATEFVDVCIDIYSDRVEIYDSKEGSDKIVVKSDLIMKSKKKREKAALKEAVANTIEQNAHSNYQATPASPMGDTVLLAEGYKSGM